MGLVGEIPVDMVRTPVTLRLSDREGNTAESSTSWAELVHLRAHNHLHGHAVTLEVLGQASSVVSIDRSAPER